MPIDLEQQLPGFARALDRDAPTITVGEIVRRESVSIEVDLPAERSSRWQRSPWYVFGAAAAVVAVLVVGLVALTQTRDDSPAPTVTLAPQPTSVVTTVPTRPTSPETTTPTTQTTTSSVVVLDDSGPAVEAFAVAVAGRTFVLLPESSDTAIERPYLSFPDIDDDEFAVVGSGGCTRLIGRGGWADASGGLVSLDGSLAVGTQGCSPGDDVMTFSASTRLRMSATSPDVLDIVDTSGSRNLVDVDTLPRATLDQLEGRWSAGTDDHLIIDPQQSLMMIDGCRTTIDLVGSQLTTSGWTGPECSDRDLLRNLHAESTNSRDIQVRLAGDVLVIIANSPDQPTQVFALPAAGPLLDPTTVSLDLGSAFGYRPGDEATASDIETDVSALLGPPTHDTGWFVTPNDPTITDHEDCMGGNTTRVLWWIDLSFVVWQLADGTERLFAWSVGDIRAVRNGDRREPYTPAASDRSDITTDGPVPIGVGTGAPDVAEAYPDAIPSTGAVFEDGALTWQLGRATLIVLDDTVVGLGSEMFFC